jgi:hypothetical protein
MTINAVNVTVTFDAVTVDINVSNAVSQPTTISVAQGV